MPMHDVDGLNAGYARLLLDEYLENPEAVPAEWRDLFESGDSHLVATVPGLARLLELAAKNGRNGSANGGTLTRAGSAGAPSATQVSSEHDLELMSGVAAAMALVKALRVHGHLAARLDPLG